MILSPGETANWPETQRIAYEFLRTDCAQWMERYFQACEAREILYKENQQLRARVERLQIT